ncbi:hypothetical protein CEQ90_17340 [Lewinellaceae bacterium SD302]|nr:hypothetical protein CEQ90_17340 [Lewinellaceae bacterium SD302]
MSKELELRYFEVILSNGQVSKTSVPVTVRNSEVYAQLVNASILSEERKGPGKVIRLVDQEAFVKFLDARFPGRKSATGGTAISNQYRYRDSKGGAKSGHGLVILRGWKTIRVNGHRVDLGEATERFGGFACFQPIIETERFCTVENLSCLAGIPARLDVSSDGEAVLDREQVYAHAYGRIGKQTFSELRCPEITHFGDWDYTGLDEYLRLQAIYPQTKLYVPEKLEDYWSTRSKPLKKEAVITRRLQESQDPKVLRVLNLLGRTNRFLEQEAIFSTNSPGQ